jgi:hypothetical protein
MFIFLTRFLLQEQKMFHTQIYGRTNFQASRGWIANFRSRHGLRPIKLCSEKLSNNQEAVDPFIIKLKEKIIELYKTFSRPNLQC